MEQNFNALFFAIKDQLNLVPVWSIDDGRKCELVDGKDYPIWKCGRCGHLWVSRKKKSKQCPKCHNKKTLIIR